MSAMKTTPQIIVALDVDTLEALREVTDRLGDSVRIYKVGSQLFTACGPAAVRFLMARGKDVFLDLKYHDIPNTVAAAVRTAVALGAAVNRNPLQTATEPFPIGRLAMLTVHTSGGAEMLSAAAEAARAAAKELKAARPLIVGVTVLTSEAQGDNILARVLERVRLAREAGLDGVVASCQEAAAVREECGPAFVIVTPGIRPQGAAVGDQKRVATPAEAARSGSNYLVIGRPILDAADPHQAVRDIVAEMG